jgi:manganese efflux pump family protein
VLALLLVALALGLSNLAASVGIGVAGAGARARLRVGIVFGLFEAGMPLLGLLLGHSLANSLGHATRWIGAALLVLVGGYEVIRAVRNPGEGGAASVPAAGLTTGRLVIAGLALSVDNLAVGFALGTYHVNVIVAVAVIGATSVTLSLLGLELGDRLGARTVGRGELIGGLVLIGVGIALAAGAL